MTPAAAPARAHAVADVKRIILDLRGAGELDVVGLNPPARTSKKEHALVQRNVQ